MGFLGVFFLLIGLGSEPEVHLADATAASGIRWKHGAGSPGKTNIREQIGSGVALLDYDGDGWLDIYLLTGPRAVAISSPGNRLYRNNRDGSFTDVTESAGLGFRGWSMGACVGDYDGDGDLDLFVANGHTYPQVEEREWDERYSQRNQLFINTGSGRFQEFDSTSPGLELAKSSRGAAFGDLDNDVAYVGNAGRKNVFNFGLNNPYPGPEPTAQRRALCRDAGICDLSGISGPVNWGTSNYNALQVKLRKAMGPDGLMLLGAYSWGKVLGTSIAGPQLWEGQPIRAWNRNWKADTGPTRYDTRHLASISWVYQLPFGRGRPLGGDIGRTADMIFGGWKLGGIGTFQTGAFLTPRDIFNASNAGGTRPNLLRNPNDLATPPGIR